MKPAQIRVVVSGNSWLGGAVGSIETAMHTLFNQATDEITCVTYNISSAARPLFTQFEHALERGIRLKLIINRFHAQHQHVRHILRDLAQRYPHLLTVISFDPPNHADLHAKIILVDHQTALVGSANLSQRGFWDNHELGIIIEGAAIYEVTTAIADLHRSRYSSTIYGKGG